MENIPLDENLDPIEVESPNAGVASSVASMSGPCVPYAPSRGEKIEALATNILLGGGATVEEAVERAKKFYRLLDEEPASQ